MDTPQESVPGAPQQPAPTKTDPAPAEALAPKVAIRHLLLLVAATAVLAWLVRLAVLGDSPIIKALILAIAVALACFASYSLLFLLTMVYSYPLRVVRDALTARSGTRAMLPATGLPATRGGKTPVEVPAADDNSVDPVNDSESAG